MSKISKIFHWREYFSPELEGRGPECFPPVIFSWKFYPFWPPLGRKFRFGLFDRRVTITWDRILRCDKMSQISKFLHWRENLAPEHNASGLESIPPENFTHIGHPEAKNFDSVLLTVVRPKPGIAF